MVCGIEPSAHHALFPPGGRAGDTPPFRLELPPIPEDHYSTPEMTPELMRGFVERAGLQVEQFVEDVVRRDCISLLIRPE